MNETGLIDYVKACARLMDLTLDDARAQRVADHLQRTAAMARQLEQPASGIPDEPVGIYGLARPAGAASRQGR